MILVQLTNGFGNNLFQYIAGRLLAEYHNQEIFVLPPSSEYYAIPHFEQMNVKFKSSIKLSDFAYINDQNYKFAFDKRYEKNNFYLKGYFEDYTYYKKHINLIKSWFPKIYNRNHNDLVIHFRGGDRLFYKNEFEHKPQVENYIKAIKQFDFEKMYIVTDMPKWDFITPESLKTMSFHINVAEENRVPLEESVNYFNSFVEGLSEFDPILQKGNVYEDFNFIRSFDNVMFTHGTLSWWAAALSDAKKVGVYGPWRQWKGNSNKNLSYVDFSGWFRWE